MPDGRGAGVAPTRSKKSAQGVGSDMRVLVVASRKGGSGKTTLSGHIAVEAERRGAGPVALMDFDPQGSLSDWWNQRKAETPVFVNSTIESLRSDIERLAGSDIRLLVIDTPPAITGAIRDVVDVADLVLVPSRPSPHDLRSAGATFSIVEGMGKPLVFVINGATARARITAEAVVALSEHGPLAPAIIHHRVDYAASMIDGRTVMELGTGGRGAEEIGLLWEYLARRLGMAAGERPQGALPHLDEADQAFPHAAALRAAS